MDASSFFRTKRIFWSWIFLPILIRIGILIGLYAAARGPQEELAREQAMAQSAPLMLATIAKNEALLKEYTPSSGLSAQERFLTDVSELLNKSGIQGTIDVNTEKTKVAAVQQYTFNISGVANDLYQLSEFLHSVEQAGYTQIENASIRKNQRRETSQINFSVLFRMVEFNKDGKQ